MIQLFIARVAASVIMKLDALAIIMDTVFGVIRAIKERKFNSSAGIDGAIRKVAMIVSIVFLAVADMILTINLIGFIPEEVRAYIGVEVVGLADFFGLLYLAYECVSILKNMTLCGLPLKKVWEYVQKFLGKYTDELPSAE